MVLWKHSFSPKDKHKGRYQTCLQSFNRVARSRWHTSSLFGNKEVNSFHHLDPWCTTWTVNVDKEFLLLWTVAVLLKINSQQSSDQILWMGGISVPSDNKRKQRTNVLRLHWVPSRRTNIDDLWANLRLRQTISTQKYFWRGTDLLKGGIGPRVWSPVTYLLFQHQ